MTDKQGLKQLRVDNWAVFFLQRLQILFAKGDCCDLILRFTTGQELKAHRLVLNTCTTYFEAVKGDENVVVLPESLPYSAVQPIINFLYSGRLEFKPELHQDLINVAKLLNITILAKLLIAQKSNNGLGTMGTIKKIATKDVKKTNMRFQNSYRHQLPHQNSQIAVGNLLANKKLPIWRQRSSALFKQKKEQEVGEPKPTRFEWPDDNSTRQNILMASPSFSELSYESIPVDSTQIIKCSPPASPIRAPVLKRRIIPLKNPIPEKFFKAENSKKVDSKDDKTENFSDDDDGHFENIHSYGDSDDETHDNSQIKPILKPKNTPVPTPIKKVRFACSPDKKDDKKEVKEMELKKVDKISPKGEKITVPIDKTETTPNHAKIIAEVLKKYPGLVKNNKNLKLKITTPGSMNAKTITIDSKNQNKASYVVVKSAGKPESATNDKTSEWQCENCGDEKLNFDTYQEYRQHLLTQHDERIDPNECEHCGYKASKRNLYLYHLYTKHQISPPKNVKFPSCPECSYVALSEGLLMKHKNTHQVAKELTCKMCDQSFKTFNSLQAHSVTCKSKDARMSQCNNCKKKFKTNNSLNAHLKVCQEKDEPVSLDTETKVVQATNTITSTDIVELPVIKSVPKEIVLPSGIILEPAILPSSEAETSIATSIGLTVALTQDNEEVILMDSNSEFYIHDNDSVLENEVHEYIVPEMLDENMRPLYNENSMPYVVSNSDVIDCPVVEVESNREDKNKKDNSQESVITENPNVRLEDIKQEIPDSPEKSQDIEEPGMVVYDEDENEQMDVQVVKDLTLEDNLSDSHEESEGEEIEKNNSYDKIETKDSKNSKQIKEEMVENTMDSDSEEIVNTSQPKTVDIIKKADSLVKDWGFDNEEENDDVYEETDKTEDKPSRLTMNL